MPLLPQAAKPVSHAQVPPSSAQHRSSPAQSHAKTIVGAALGTALVGAPVVGAALGAALVGAPVVGAAVGAGLGRFATGAAVGLRSAATHAHHFAYPGAGSPPKAPDVQSAGDAA